MRVYLVMRLDLAARGTASSEVLNQRESLVGVVLLEVLFHQNVLRLFVGELLLFTGID